jgi:palmitoyltransferase ZDHHC1/11
MSSTRRKNGFELPLNPLQIITWALFPFVIVHYFAFLFILLWNYVVVKVIVTLVFGISSVSALYTGYMCCLIDPADNAVLSDQRPSDEEDGVYCYLCERNVDDTSKHCRFCDKCVVGFDHHCK